MAVSQPSWTRIQPTSNLAKLLVQYMSTPNLKPLNQSIQKISIGHRQNAKFARLFKVWPMWPCNVRQIQNLGRMFRTVVRCTHTQNSVFLAIRVQEIWPIVCFPRWPPGCHIEMRELKKMQFSVCHTYSRWFGFLLFGDCCIMFCDRRMHRRTEKVKKI
jgi:hypothetical protein